MRMLLKVTIPVDAGNAAIREGRLSQVLQSLLGELKPEGAYFLAQNGRRTALIFFDLKDPSQTRWWSSPSSRAPTPASRSRR